MKEEINGLLFNEIDNLKLNYKIKYVDRDNL